LREAARNANNVLEAFKSDRIEVGGDQRGVEFWSASSALR